MKRGRLYLAIILAACFLLRIRHIQMCDVGDRGQVALGVTANLPPLYHYVSQPFFALSGNAWYAPAVANASLCVLLALCLYWFGRELKDERLGLMLALAYALNPADILYSRFISPETVEVFFVGLIVISYARIEILGKRDCPSLLFFGLSVMIGAFSKQQTLLILVPLFVFGLLRRKLGVFRMPEYYIAGFAALPYISFLLTHPEMLSAIYIYMFVQPSTAAVTAASKLLYLLSRSALFMLPYIPLAAYAALTLKKHNKKTISMAYLMIAVSAFYLVTIIKLDPYIHNHILTLSFLAGLGLAVVPRRAIVISGLVAFTIATTFLIIPGLSRVTLQACEQNALGLPQTIFERLLGIQPSDGNNFFSANIESIDRILADEKYIILGGDAGQDLKYWLKPRIYNPGIMNSDRYNEIGYAMLVIPPYGLNTTYTGAPAWDYEYNRILLNNSEIIWKETAYGREYALLRILNHSTEGLEISDFRNRSREALKLP